MTDDELKEYLYSQGYRHLRDVPDNGICGTFKFIFTYALVVDMDWSGYGHRYCFHTEREAVTALKKWDGITEPEGFIVKK